MNSGDKKKKIQPQNQGTAINEVFIVKVKLGVRIYLLVVRHLVILQTSQVTKNKRIT